jgi:hypothetical protein
MYYILYIRTIQVLLGSVICQRKMKFNCMLYSDYTGSIGITSCILLLGMIPIASALPCPGLFVSLFFTQMFSYQASALRSAC